MVLCKVRVQVYNRTYALIVRKEKLVTTEPPTVDEKKKLEENKDGLG